MGCNVSIIPGNKFCLLVPLASYTAVGTREISSWHLIWLTTCLLAGTDATHAEHIETIKTRMYVGLTADQRFLPGHLGMGLVEGKGSAC